MRAKSHKPHTKVLSRQVRSSSMRARIRVMIYSQVNLFCERALACEHVSTEVKTALLELHQRLGLVMLKNHVEQKLKKYLSTRCITFGNIELRSNVRAKFRDNNQTQRNIQTQRSADAPADNSIVPFCIT